MYPETQFEARTPLKFESVRSEKVSFQLRTALKQFCMGRPSTDPRIRTPQEAQCPCRFLRKLTSKTRSFETEGLRRVLRGRDHGSLSERSDPFIKSRFAHCKLEDLRRKALNPKPYTLNPKPDKLKQTSSHMPRLECPSVSALNPIRS